MILKSDLIPVKLRHREMSKPLSLNRKVCYSVAMVLLKELNAQCSVRPVARTVPGQIACRIFGNAEKPCILDPVCRPCEKHGLKFFYGSLGLAGGAVFLLLFWIFRISRAYKLFGLLFGLLLPPVRWVLRSAVTAKRWWDSLFF